MPTDELVARIAGVLGPRGELMGTAESCTGGLVAKLLTDRAGSSAWFERGLVTYTNRAKQELLGVPEAVFVEHGAVSQACVIAMAEGLRDRASLHWTLAVSGIAGPGGGTPDKPVGTVWFAWAQGGGETVAECRRFDGDREAVREAAAHFALARLLERLERDA